MGGPDTPPLSSALAHVWLVNLAAVPLDRGVLDPMEQARQSHIRSEASRREFVRTRTALRRILAPYLDVTPEAVRLDQKCVRCGGNHGPVRLVGSGPHLQLSISHAGGEVALIGVAQSALGVDVECSAPPEEDLLEIVHRCFTPTEARRVEAHTSPSDRGAEFLDIWTRKEAYLKAIGEGLLRPMDSFEVGTADTGPLAWSDWDDTAEWAIHRLSGVGRSAAVVTRAGVSVLCPTISFAEGDKESAAL